MPSSPPLRDRIAKIVADTFGIALDDVTPDLAYGSIDEWDSVGHLDLIVAVVEAFDLKLTTDLVAELTSVSAIEAHLAKAGIA